MSTETNTLTAPPNYHRIEVTMSPRLGGEVNFAGVCTAPVGTSCRMWCNEPECEELSSDEHDAHERFDQGSCSYIESLNGDPGYISELYTGEETALRSAPITITADCDGVTWEYSDEIYAYCPEDNPRIADRWFYQDGGQWMAVTPEESITEWFQDIEGGFQPWMVRSIADVPAQLRHFREADGQEHSVTGREGLSLDAAERAELEAYRSRDAAGWVEYALSIPEDPQGDPENHKNLNLSAAICLRNAAKAKNNASTAVVVQRIHPAVPDWAPTTGPACEKNCRHQCGECRLGLGIHRSCDPRCDHHLPAPM